MYCKKCGMSQLSLDYDLCIYCAGGRRHRFSLYWEWHNGRYDKEDDPIGDIDTIFRPVKHPSQGYSYFFPHTKWINPKKRLDKKMKL